jgi:hypothetical protein
MVDSKKARGGKEIPIPEVRFVPTYYKDYYPLYKPPLTYLHGKRKCHLSQNHMCFDSCAGVMECYAGHVPHG